MVGISVYGKEGLVLSEPIIKAGEQRIVKQTMPVPNTSAEAVRANLATHGKRHVDYMVLVASGYFRYRDRAGRFRRCPSSQSLLFSNATGMFTQAQFGSEPARRQFWNEWLKQKCHIWLRQAASHKFNDLFRHPQLAFDPAQVMSDPARPDAQFACGLCGNFVEYKV
jgi:hypothetical protein